MTAPIGSSLISSRIAALHDAIQTGDAAAIDAFWETVATTGTPLYEIQQSGGGIIEQFATVERLPLRFYLEAGLLEDHRDGSATSILRANRQLRNVLCAKGYWVHYVEYCGGHQYINWRGTFAHALQALLQSSGC